MGLQQHLLRRLLEHQGDPHPGVRPDTGAPQGDLLLAVPTAPTRKVTIGVPPKIRIEPKGDLIARRGRCPNRSDAVGLGLYAELLVSTSGRAASAVAR
ncbi:hypothetical protein ACIOHH_16395 [Streptomyces microflavus]|uniref:hypothetical protein n=1 Tax=Streptomyces microflavus TaxID=1919 RepID=UPI0038305C21